MVKLNERKIRWIIQQKLRGRGAGEIALIQRVPHRRVEQIWQAYKQTGIPPTLELDIQTIAQEVEELIGPLTILLIECLWLGPEAEGHQDGSLTRGSSRIIKKEVLKS